MMDTQKPEQENPFSEVVCAGCRACCINDTVMIHPEHGDNVADYETEVMPHPITGKQGFMLKRLENGHCFYLGENGCTIHEKKPFSCRQFDCRKTVACMPHKMREEAVEKNMMSRKVINAGLKRQDSMNDLEKRMCAQRRTELIEGRK